MYSQNTTGGKQMGGAIAEAIIGGIQGLTNTGVGIWNAYNQYENQQWQRDLQQQIFLREDSAVQRRVQDLRAAGLSATLAAGSPAAVGQSVRSDAAQIPDIDIQSPMVKAAELDQFLKQSEANIQSTLADRDLKLAEKSRVDELTTGEQIDNVTKSARNDLGLDYTRAQMTHITNQDRLIAQEVINAAKQNDRIQQDINESTRREDLIRQQIINAWQDSRNKDLDYYMQQMDNLMKEREHMIDLMLNTRMGGSKANITDIGKLWDMVARNLFQGKSQESMNDSYANEMIDRIKAYRHNNQLDTGIR